MRSLWKAVSVSVAALQRGQPQLAYLTSVPTLNHGVSPHDHAAAGVRYLSEQGTKKHRLAQTIVDRPTGTRVCVETPSRAR